MGFFSFLLKTILLVVPLAVILGTVNRLIHILDPRRRKPIRHGRRNPNEPTHLLIVLGSGGHTAEMLAMLTRAVTTSPSPKVDKLVWKDFAHRTWVVGEGDSISAERAKEFEEMATPLNTQEHLMAGNIKRATDIGAGAYEVKTVPRARAIHQPLATSPMSSWACAKACWDVLTSHMSSTRDGHASKAGEVDFPDVILCNGPATATILVFVAIVLRFFDYKGCNTRGKMRTVYVESWARVKKLSLSGRLLKQVVDRFLVQWPQLEKAAGGRAEYCGVLV